MFFMNPAHDTTMYLGPPFQQLRRNRLQDKFWMPVFLIKNTCSETSVSLILQIIFMKRTKNWIKTKT